MLVILCTRFEVEDMSYKYVYIGKSQQRFYRYTAKKPDPHTDCCDPSVDCQFRNPHMDHFNPHVDQESDPPVDQNDPCVDQ